MFCGLLLTWGRGASIPYTFRYVELGCYGKEHPLKRTSSAQCTSTIVFSMAFLLLIKMSVPNLTHCIEKKIQQPKAVVTEERPRKTTSELS